MSSLHEAIGISSATESCIGVVVKFLISQLQEFGIFILDHDSTCTRADLKVLASFREAR